MDSADDLRGHWLVRTTFTWDNAYGRLCVVASFENSSDTSSTAACAGIGPPYSGSGRWVCFTGQPRTGQEYKGRGSKVPLYLGLDRQMASLLSSKDGPGVSDSLG